MKITRSDSRWLVIADFPYLIGVIAFPVGLFLLVHAALFLPHARGHTGDIVGSALGGLMFVVGGVVFTKRSVFEFDLLRRKLRWSRTGVFTRAGGTVQFDDIRPATVQSIIGNSGANVPSYRVALLTAAGEIPLTNAYSAGERDRADKIRSTINDALKLNLDAAAQVENDILELAMAGRSIDAIRLTRERYGYDLAQAMQFVDELRGGGGGGGATASARA